MEAMKPKLTPQDRDFWMAMGVLLGASAMFLLFVLLTILKGIV
jgi:hypothetical protein